MTDRLLTPAETAAALRIAEKTLTTWRCKGRYPALTFIRRGRAIYYLESVVQAFAVTSQAL